MRWFVHWVWYKMRLLPNKAWNWKAMKIKKKNLGSLRRTKHNYTICLFDCQILFCKRWAGGVGLQDCKTLPQKAVAGFHSNNFEQNFQNLISLLEWNHTLSWSFFAIFKETFGFILGVQYHFKLLPLSLSHKSYVRPALPTFIIKAYN